MFAEKSDLKNNIYNYQTDQITEGDDNIVLHAINAAISEVKSYLTWNDKKEYLDGRPHYDVEAIFSKTGADRNPLILNHVLTIAKYYIIDLSNVDILMETAEKRYDRAIDWLKQLSKGSVNLDELPVIPDDEEPGENENGGFSYGSRVKFNHE